MIDLARTNPDLTEVASSGPWVMFQVSDSELVTPLVNEPAVVNGASAGGKTWLNDTVSWYMDKSDFDVPLAASGPPEWQRIDPGDTPEARPVGTTEVSNITSGTDTISFDVSEVGVPVVVKASYFPNWQVSGAKGPYGSAPTSWSSSRPATTCRCTTATRRSTTCRGSSPCSASSAWPTCGAPSRSPSPRLPPCGAKPTSGTTTRSRIPATRRGGPTPTRRGCPPTRPGVEPLDPDAAKQAALAGTLDPASVILGPVSPDAAAPEPEPEPDSDLPQP